MFLNVALVVLHAVELKVKIVPFGKKVRSLISEANKGWPVAIVIKIPPLFVSISL
jgi:hypothetical protein